MTAFPLFVLGLALGLVLGGFVVALVLGGREIDARREGYEMGREQDLAEQATQDFEKWLDRS